MSLELKQAYDVGHALWDDPLIVVFDDFVSESESAHIVNIARAKMKRSKVTTDDELAISADRTGSTAWIAHDATPVIKKVVGRVSDLVGIPTTHAESLQIVHYAESQEYRPHYDAWKVGSDRHAQRIDNGGQRLVTALMYLNAVEAGGGTGFPNVGVEVQPLPGRMVVFHNTTGADHDVHPDSLHGGMPVHYGEKWACNLWFRERPYRRPNATRASSGGRPGSARAKARSKQKRKNQKAARRRNR